MSNVRSRTSFSESGKRIQLPADHDMGFPLHGWEPHCSLVGLLPTVSEPSEASVFCFVED